MATVVQYPARSGRSSELVLLVAAILVGVGGYLSVMASHPEAPATTWYWHCAAIAICGVGAHVALRFLAPYADPVILPITLALNGMGLAMIARLDLYYTEMGTDAALSQVRGNSQLIYMIGGVVILIAVLVLFRDHQTFRKFSWVSLVLGIFLMLATLIPGLGVKSYGSYISVSLFGISIQPNEFAKILLAIFFAGYLEYRRDSLAIAGKKVGFLQLPRWRDFLPIGVVWVAALGLLVIQKDLGSALLIFSVFVGVLYVATDRPSWLVFGAVLLAPIAVVAYSMFTHLQQRVTNWLHAFDPKIMDCNQIGGSCQLVKGLFGMAYGGLTGAGWGRGMPGLTPLANSDFIVASLAEELGLTGMMAFFMFYLILVSRGMRTALGVRDGFGKLLATALTFSIGAQLFIVVGGITRIIPSTGLTAPFVAAGGASLLANWIGIAILLRISDSARRPLPPPLAEKSTQAAAGVITEAPTERVVRA